MLRLVLKKVSMSGASAPVVTGSAVPHLPYHSYHNNVPRSLTLRLGQYFVPVSDIPDNLILDVDLLPLLDSDGAYLTDD